MHGKSTLSKEQIIRKIFLKYGYDDKEVDISMQSFQGYIEKGLKVVYQDWINNNTIKTIEKYIDYYQTH